MFSPGDLEAYRIKQTIRYRGINVTLLDKKLNPGDLNDIVAQAFKFDYERDIAGQPVTDGNDPEKDVTIFYFGAEWNNYLEEGNRIRVPGGEIFVISGRIHRQYLNNILIYVNCPTYRHGLGE